LEIIETFVVGRQRPKKAEKMQKTVREGVGARDISKELGRQELAAATGKGGDSLAEAKK